MTANHPLRIAFVAPGNSIHTRRWLEHFAKQGHTVGLVSYGPLTERIEGIDLLFEHRSLPRDTGIVRCVRLVMAALRTRTVLRRFAPDLVHAHFVTGPGWLAAAAGRGPLVVSAWGSDVLVDSHRRFLGSLNRVVLRRAGCVLCDSAQLVDEVRRVAPRARVERAMWGVDVNLFSPGAGQTHARFTVLPIRGLLPLQQPHVIIGAFASARSAGVDAELLLKLGPADAEVPENLSRLVDELRVTDSVRVIPQVPHEQLVELYRRADVCVSVPTTDGTSVALLEAMATGVPVIVSDIPANREWVVDGENGLVVPPGDVEALCAALTRLAVDPDARQRMGNAARATAAARAGEGPSMLAVEEIYRSIALA